MTYIIMSGMKNLPRDGIYSDGWVGLVAETFYGKACQVVIPRSGDCIFRIINFASSRTLLGRYSVRRKVDITRTSVVQEMKADAVAFLQTNCIMLSANTSEMTSIE